MERIDWSRTDALIDHALDEDIDTGDVTTRSIVGVPTKATAQITAKRACVVAGLFLVQRIYERLSKEVVVEPLVAEGKKVNSGTVICRIHGPFDTLLVGERTVLNFLQRLCGVASVTQRFVRAVKDSKCKVLDTRKTTPGMRSLEKYAVRCGGGTNHRFGLYDAILIKENHIAAAGGVQEAIEKAREASPTLPLEIEVQNMGELVLAVEYGADIVLLDNFSVADVRKAVSMVGQRVQLEVSGGIQARTVKPYAQTGVHRISIGALTHSVKACDLSMLIVPDGK